MVFDPHAVELQALLLRQLFEVVGQDPVSDSTLLVSAEHAGRAQVVAQRLSAFGG